MPTNVTTYKRGETIRVKRGKHIKEMVVVARWAAGEGHGYAAKLPGQQNHECVDVPARRIVN